MNLSKLFSDMRQVRKDLLKVPHTPELMDFTSDNCVLVSKSSAINAIYRDYHFKLNLRCVTIQQLMDQCSSGIYAALELCVEKDVSIKALTAIKVLFCKINFTDGLVESYEVSY